MGSTSRDSGTLIHSGLNRSLQTYSIYDIQGRLTHFYEAHVPTKQDGPAFLTEYKYVGTSSVLIATKETVVKWDSSYDFDVQP